MSGLHTPQQQQRASRVSTKHVNHPRTRSSAEASQEALVETTLDAIRRQPLNESVQQHGLGVLLGALHLHAELTRRALKLGLVDRVVDAMLVFTRNDEVQDDALNLLDSLLTHSERAAAETADRIALAPQVIGLGVVDAVVRSIGAIGSGYLTHSAGTTPHAGTTQRTSTARWAWRSACSARASDSPTRDLPTRVDLPSYRAGRSFSVSRSARYPTRSSARSTA
eukprot:1208007-Prymnesium_polylepis.1